MGSALKWNITTTDPKATVQTKLNALDRHPSFNCISSAQTSNVVKQFPQKLERQFVYTIRMDAICLSN
jgi:hypothetical protein